MRNDDGAAFYLAKFILVLLVEFVELLSIFFAVRLVIGLVVGIGLNKRPLDILEFGLGVLGAQPHVRVVLACVFVLARGLVFFGCHAQCDAVGSLADGRFRRVD